jgi:hypothetical protein
VQKQNPKVDRVQLENFLVIPPVVNVDARAPPSGHPMPREDSFVFGLHEAELRLKLIGFHAEQIRSNQTLCRGKETRAFNLSGFYFVSRENVPPSKHDPSGDQIRAIIPHRQIEVESIHARSLSMRLPSFDR